MTGGLSKEELDKIHKDIQDGIADLIKREEEKKGSN